MLHDALINDCLLCADSNTLSQGFLSRCHSLQSPTGCLKQSPIITTILLFFYIITYYEITHKKLEKWTNASIEKKNLVKLSRSLIIRSTEIKMNNI